MSDPERGPNGVRAVQAKVAEMVQTQHLRSLTGLINVLQVVLGFGALFATCFIWSSTNVYFQWIFAGYGWQTLIVFILLFTWIINLVILITALLGRPILEDQPKIRILILYGICLVGLIISAALESWYANLSVGHEIFHPRFVTTCIFNWLLVISYFVLIALTVIFDR